HNLWYTDFNFHGCFSFLLGFWDKTLVKEKHPFLYLFKIHTKYYTLPGICVTIRTLIHRDVTPGIGRWGVFVSIGCET
ncbi:MAG: hypothetical protein QF876_10170, partial [Desulfobacterales bacterium]|nr:hypothetical protein [Desulfobacterales bacterium]